MTITNTTDAVIGPLADFQNEFVQTLMAAGADSPAFAISKQPGFAVYRNTVMKSCVDALQANFPAVTRLVGEKWFRAAAAIYARESPPDDPTLLRYGAAFTSFLDAFEPAAELPYLPAVARLDRLWTEAHIAHDEETMDVAAIVNLNEEKLLTAALDPHAAARWAWFTHAPAFSIWSSNRAADTFDKNSLDGENCQPDWKAEGALITRPHGTVKWCALDAAGCAFLDACAAGQTLAESANAAMAAQPDADLQKIMATLLEAGAFSRMSFP